MRASGEDPPRGADGIPDPHGPPDPRATELAAAMDDITRCVDAAGGRLEGLLTALMARDAADDLAGALRTNREVGLATGVLMHRHRVTRGAAFDLLRVASQASARSLEGVATEVVDTGDLPLPGVSLERQEAADDGPAEGNPATD